MDIKTHLTISSEQWQVIDKVSDMIKEYKTNRYNRTNISVDKLLGIYKKGTKLNTWYADDKGLTLEGCICLLAKKHSIPTYAVFVLLDAYGRYRQAKDLGDNARSLMNQIFKIDNKPYFTLHINSYLAYAFDYAYSSRQYYTAVTLLVRKGLLLYSRKRYKQKKLYTLTSKALVDEDIMIVAFKRINELCPAERNIDV